MEVSSKYGYTDKKKLKMNGLAERSHKSDNNCNSHDTNDSSDSVSSGEDNQMPSQREMSSGTSNTSRSSSRDGMSGQSGCLNQDGQRRRSSEDGMLVANGMPIQGAMSAQGELQLQQDGSGRVQSRKQRTFTPEVSKDTTYWEKRRKNNEAARRSREKRRQYDMARERSVQDITALNKYLIRQLCILKLKLGIPVNETVEGSNEDSEQIDRDCRALMAALLAETSPVNESGSPGNLAVNIALHRTSPNTAITTAKASFSDMPMQNSMNGERQNLFNLSPADSVTSSYSMKSFKSESAHQPPASRLKFEIVPLGMIKQEPQDEFPNMAFANSNTTSRSIDNFSNASEIFENTTSGVNMVRDTSDLLINGRRSFSTSPSSWYPVPVDHSVAGVVVGHHGQLPNGINLTNHANASTPSPTSSSSSINNFSMSNGHSISQLPVQQEEDEPLQLTVNKRARLDSDNSSEVPDPAEDLQWNCNSRNRLSSPTANSNSHRSAHSLPLKLRHKASLPDHTIALTHSLTPTTMISSTAFGNSTLANLNHSQTNGLSHLSDVALSQNGPLPLLKRDANGKILHQRNSQCKENDNSCIGSNNSVTDNEKNSPDVEDLNAKDPSAGFNASEIQFLDSDSSQINIERLKDPKYVERRRRNNEAARKCRENRKTLHQMREAQTSFYEMQNSHLKVKVAQQREELGRLQLLLKKKQETGTIPSLSHSKNNDKNSDEDETDVGNTKKYVK